MAGLLDRFLGYGPYPGGPGQGDALSGGMSPNMGLLSDTLLGIGTGLLSQQPSAGKVSPFTGIGDGLRYANQLNQQRRSSMQQQFQNQLAQQGNQREQQMFDMGLADKKKQEEGAAAQQQAVDAWVATQPPEHQALYHAYPDLAAKSFFESQKQNGPQSGIAKLAADRKAGLISQAEYDAAVRKENYIAPQQGPQPPSSVQEYQFAVNHDGYKGTFQQWTAENNKRDSGLGMQGYWGTDKNTGQQVLFQLSPSGTAQQTQLPPNIDPTKPLVPVNTGTGTAMVNPITGTAQNVIPKDIQGEEAQKTVGTATGTARVNLPQVQQSAALIHQTLDLLKNHPGRQAATGLSSVFNGVALPGSDRKDFLVAQQQLKGQVFLNAYDTLRGGGAITETEGAKAEQAKARLDTAQSEDEYLKALDDFGAAVDELVTIAQQKAQGNFSGAPAASGNPNDPLGLFK